MLFDIKRYKLNLIVCCKCIKQNRYFKFDLLMFVKKFL